MEKYLPVTVLRFSALFCDFSERVAQIIYGNIAQKTAHFDFSALFCDFPERTPCGVR